MTKRFTESIPVFDYREILEITSVQTCQVCFLSPETIQLCLSSIRLAEYPTRWRGLTDLNNDPITINQAISLYYQAVKELLVTCDIEGLTSNLDRIATALESIEQNQTSVLTAQEWLDFLENTYGVTHLLYIAAYEAFQMLPDLSVKLDYVALASMVSDYFWRGQLMIQIAGHTAATTSIATAVAAHLPVAVAEAFTSKVIGIADLILTLTGQLRSWVFGDFNILSDVVQPIWQWWFDLGSPPEPIPTDPEATQIRQAIALEAIAGNIACSVCGGTSSGGCGCTPGSGPVVQPDEAPGQPAPGTPDPENPPPNYPPSGAPAYDVYKCAAAQFLVDQYGIYVNNFTSLSGILSTYTAAILSLMGANLFFAPFSPFFTALISAVSSGFLWSYLLTVLPGLSGLAALFGTYKSNLDAAREDFICALYEAQDVSAARSVISTFITDAMPVGIPAGWVSYHLDNLFPNNVLNILFELYQPAADYDGGFDCTNCIEVTPCWEFTETIEDWSAGEQFPSFEPGGSYGSVSWTSDNGGKLNLTLETQGPNQYGSAVSPLFSHVIEMGDYICVDINSVTPAGSLNIYGGLLIDGAEVQWFTPNTGNAVGISAISLNTWVGQELQQIYLGYGRSNTSPNVVVGIASICLNETPCP